MARSSLAGLLAVAALAGCGAEDERAVTTTRTAAAPPPTRTVAAPPERCVAARSPGFRLCSHAFGAPPRTPSTIQRREGGDWRVVAKGPPGSVHDGVQIGHWAGAWLSPDGGTLLAQWSAECEIPIAFFVDAGTGKMRPVTGERKWTEAPESVALGWSQDGRARVRLTKGYCGGSKHPPGLYLVEPATSRLTLVKRAAARG